MNEKWLSLDSQLCQFFRSNILTSFLLDNPADVVNNENNNGLFLAVKLGNIIKFISIVIEVNASWV